MARDSNQLKSTNPVAGRARRLAAFAALGIATGFVLPVFAGLFSGCASEPSGLTGGRRVVLATRLALSPDGDRFTTPLGWDVTLTRAYVATGVLRYFDGVPPLAGRAAPAQGREFALGWFGLGVAHAHPGHYQAGHVLGEMLVPSSVDLLAGTARLADGEGVSGTYRSGRFAVSAPLEGPFAAALEGHVALAEGRAEKAGESTRWFRAFADLAEVAESAPDGEIDGCVFEAANVDADGTVTVLVSPSEWFTLVDFRQLDAGSEDAPAELPPGSQPRIAFAQGVAELSAYRFSFRSGDSEP